MIRVDTYGHEDAVRVVSESFHGTELVIYTPQDPGHKGQYIFSIDTNGMSLYLRFSAEDLRKLPEMLDEMDRRNAERLKGESK